MSRKCKHTTVAVIEEQYYRNCLLTDEPGTTVTRLLANLLDRLPRAFLRAHCPKSQPANSNTPTENRKKFILKLCSRLIRNNPAAYKRFPLTVLWQYPSIVSANA